MAFEDVVKEVVQKALACIGKNRGVITVSMLGESCLQTKTWVINPDFAFVDEEYLSKQMEGFNLAIYQTNLICVLSVLTAGLLNEIHCGCTEPEIHENPDSASLPCVYLHNSNTAVGIIVSGENYEWQEEILAKMKE